jgi:uncharacterized protein involved in copper resistance
MGGGMATAAMPGMDHGAMPMPMITVKMPGMNHGAMAMDHSKHIDGRQPARQTDARSPACPDRIRAEARTCASHTPRTNLDDPGVGLRNNGRKVLTFADLATIGGPIDTRGAGSARSNCT